MDKHRSILWCNDQLSRGFINTQYLYKQTKRNLDFVRRLAVDRKLDVHNGCVNTICWNDVGNYILSGSDDQHLIITNPFTKKVAASIHSGHRANIFSAKFLPNTRDNHIISCSGDGIVCFTNVEREDSYGDHTFDCHLGTAYEVMTVPNDSHTFLSCGEDGTVRWFDLRIKDKCDKPDCREDVMINCRRAVTALGINPLAPYQLAVGCSDSSVRMFDRRMLGTKSTGNYTGRGITGMYSRFTAPNLEGKSHRITSLEFSHDGHEVLVSYSSEYIYLFNMKEDARFQKFSTKEPVAPPSMERLEVREKPTPTTSMCEDVLQVEDDDPDLGPTGAEGAGGSERQPPIKRLRLRGDWSDTGPQARPETSADRPHTSLMQRMSDMLTRWFDDNNRRQSGPRDPDESPGADNPAGGGNQPAAGGAGSNEGEETDVAPPTSSDGTGDDACATSSLPNLRLPVSQGIPESSSSSDSLSSPSTVVAITPCIEKRLVTVDEDIAEEQSQHDSSTSDITESTPINTVSENITSDSGSTELKEDSVTDNGASPCDQTDTSPSLGQKKQLASSSSCEESASSSTLEVLETINNEVSSIRERILTTDVEPVISLEYSSEGTTASTIKVGFTPSEGVIDIDNEPMQSTSINSRVPPTVSHGAKTEKSQSVDVKSDIISSQYAACSVDIASASSSSQLVTQLPAHSLGTQESLAERSESVRPELGPWETVSAFEMKLGTASPLPESDVTMTSDEICKESDKIISDDKPIMKEIRKNLDSSIKDANSSGPNEHCVVSIDAKTTGECSAKSQGSESETRDLSPMEQGSECLSAMETDSSCEPSVGGHPPLSQEGKGDKEKRKDLVDKNDGCDKDKEADALEGVKSSGVEGAPSGRIERAEDDELDETAGPSGSQEPRQRRIGYSGPPTGNFQLYSSTARRGDDTDDESEDDDVGNHRIRRVTNSLASFSHTREGGRWATANAVAKRLQRMYRKRQEEREKEEDAMRNVHEPAVKMVYKGHRNARTMIKEANFWGDKYVMSGSDCGHIFIWDRYTAELVMLLEADKHVVNCLQPHPYYPILASSGIDYDVKIWSPSQRDIGFDMESAKEVTKRNEVMLEETRDTITVPASFMLRMLASLNNIRTGRQEERQNEESSSGED
ncbi:DDB1- and CUL4-associated factor 6-like isoform X2 [Lineus longissimus]|uniref:DDB1- and CUL4-associated factor 6-like isoform X2 n=1 Tax=Lineus longissimus TaxID=88925 RepID=UPI00315CD99F